MVFRSSLVRLASRLLQSPRRQLLHPASPRLGPLLSAALKRKHSSTTKMTSSEYIFPNNQPVVYLDCDSAFNSLSAREKLYSHHLSRASWYGGLIVLYQTSPESPLIFLMLHKLYSSVPPDQLRSLALEKAGLSEDDYQALLVYSCGLFENLGNYKSFGDSKFIPNLPRDKLESLLKTVGDQEILELWAQCGDKVYSLGDTEKRQGFSNVGVTTYFSKNCTKKDSELVNQFMKEKSLEGYNTRLFKLGEQKYEVRLASVLSTEDNEDNDLLGSHQLESIPGHQFVVTRGDYSPLLALVNTYLSQAKEYAANENERKMLELYAQSFKTGVLEHHIDGSRYWIKDKGPVVETYIGFIETYRDPAGIRGEFEGFVAVVNKPMSQKFMELVSMAENLLPQLPWPQEFEKDKFLLPDFTSLDVLTFAGSMPSGICIPNYDSVRQNEGFKNVSLGNVIHSSTQESVPNYLGQEDCRLVSSYKVPAFEMQVGLHELLGHGSGKMLQQLKDGSFNFDRAILDPLSRQQVDSYYKPGETYDSVFSTLGSAYEECRAECVGLYLSTDPTVTKVFGFKGEQSEEVMYVNWLSLVHSAVESLPMYDASSSTWLQAHSQARFAILQVLLEAGMVTLEPTTGSDGKPDLRLTLDRSKILSVGKPAIGDFLLRLQLYRSTAAVDKARQMFDMYSQVDATFLSYRAIAVDRKKPRKLFVRANTRLNGQEEVELVKYDSSPEGHIQSWVDRFPAAQEDTVALRKALLDLYNKDKTHFQ